MEVVLCSLIGYLIGNINAAYILSKLKGFDIRDRGSGNAGASNAIITMGKKAGLISAIFDISKAAIAASVAVYIFPKIKFGKNSRRFRLHFWTHFSRFYEISRRKRSCLSCRYDNFI